MRGGSRLGSGDSKSHVDGRLDGPAAARNQIHIEPARRIAGRAEGAVYFDDELWSAAARLDTVLGEAGFNPECKKRPVHLSRPGGIWRVSFALRGWVRGRKTPAQGCWILWADGAERRRLHRLIARSRPGKNRRADGLKVPKERPGGG